MKNVESNDTLYVGDEEYWNELGEIASTVIEELLKVSGWRLYGQRRMALQKTGLNKDLWCFTLAEYKASKETRANIPGRRQHSSTALSEERQGRCCCHRAHPPRTKVQR